QLTRQDGQVILAVEDSGCGIPEGEMAQIFEPFYRSADARRRGVAGIGLGLAVAARLAKAFGGRIEVESRVGGGSRFAVYFPAVEQERSSRYPAEVAATRGNGKGQGSDLRTRRRRRASRHDTRP